MQVFESYHNLVLVWIWMGHLVKDSSKRSGVKGRGERRSSPLRITTHLSLIGEASQETLPLTPVQDLQLFVVDAVLLPYVLPRVQRRPLLVHAKLPTASAAAGLWEGIKELQHNPQQINDWYWRQAWPIIVRSCCVN